MHVTKHANTNLTTTTEISATRIFDPATGEVTIIVTTRADGGRYLHSDQLTIEQARNLVATISNVLGEDA